MATSGLCLPHLGFAAKTPFSSLGKRRKLDLDGTLPGVTLGDRFTLNPRDIDILDALSIRVRLFSVAQVARTWWGSTSAPESNAQKRLKLLEAAGLVTRFNLMARPELPLEAPVLIWEPGQATPDLGAASYQLQSRFTAPLQTTPCVIATSRAATKFGGYGGRFPKYAEQTHDVHVAAMYLRYRSLRPDLIRHWISEEIIKRTRQKIKGDKLPDAMIRTGDYERVIEFGGEYEKEKLIAFHDYCVKKDLPYELW
jgi:hypothetical protein